MHSDRRSCIYHGSCLPLKQHAHLTSPSHACHGTGVSNPDMPSGEPAKLMCRVRPWRRAWCTFGSSHSPCTLLLELLSAARQACIYIASSSATLIPILSRRVQPCQPRATSPPLRPLCRTQSSSRHRLAGPKPLRVARRRSTTSCSWSRLL